MASSRRLVQKKAKTVKNGGPLALEDSSQLALDGGQDAIEDKNLIKQALTTGVGAEMGEPSPSSSVYDSDIAAGDRSPSPATRSNKQSPKEIVGVKSEMTFVPPKA